ncbi:MAG: C10 family peptidase [Bacteroidota bacterium]
MKLLKKCRRCSIYILLFAALFACRKTAEVSKEPLKENHVRLVTANLASQVAENFDAEGFSKNGRHVPTLSTSKKTIKSTEIVNDAENIPAFYIFNYTNGGFVIVSADFNHEPIMAYVKDGSLTRKDKITAGLATWMVKTVSNVELLRQGLYDNTERAERVWLQYLPEKTIRAGSPALSTGIPPSSVTLFGYPPDDPQIPCDQVDVASVGPLVPYHWGQSCGFNDQCDVLNSYGCNIGCGNDRPLAGCVAISVAQIMAYWQYPAWYNYSSMLAYTGVPASQALIADVGTWSWMDYGCTSSGASSENATWALTSIFGYSGGIYSSYNSGSYMDVKQDISWSRPVILTAYHDAADAFGFTLWPQSGTGHQWVCDGWLTYNYYCPGIGYLYFNMNWGWNGYLDGWYAFNNWTVTHWNGAQWNFQYYKSYIHNIHP